LLEWDIIPPINSNYQISENSAKPVQVVCFNHFPALCYIFKTVTLKRNPPSLGAKKFFGGIGHN